MGVIAPQIGDKSLVACNDVKCTTNCKIDSAKYPYYYVVVEIYNGNDIAKTVYVAVVIDVPYGQEMLDKTTQISPNTLEEIRLGPVYFRGQGDYTFDQVYPNWM